MRNLEKQLRRVVLARRRLRNMIRVEDYGFATADIERAEECLGYAIESLRQDLEEANGQTDLPY